MIAAIRGLAQTWAKKRQGADRDPVSLHRRRIYILPTGLGLGFGLMLFAMLLGSMNYNSSLGLALTFLLSSLGLVTMHYCHRNLVDLVVRSAGAESVFAGQEAVFRIVVENPSRGIRYDIQASKDDHEAIVSSIEPANRSTLDLGLPTERRGEFRVERFSLASSYPFNLFRAWTWIHMDLHCTVYPKPAPRGRQPPPEHTDTGGAQDDSRGDDDFAGFRSYRPGDSSKHVAWKAFAKGQELLVKQYSGTAVTSYHFDWNSLPDLNTEDRLSLLCRWVVDAHTDGHAFGLRLPGDVVEPNLGRAHRERCLTNLALHGLPSTGGVRSS